MEKEGSARASRPTAMARQAAPDAAIWVIETVRAGQVGQAHALAGRLGNSFRRVRDVATAEADGQPPHLILTSGVNGGLAGLTLGRRFDAPVVHCASQFARVTRGRPFDMSIVPSVRPRDLRDDRVMTVFGPLTSVSPTLFDRARRLWGERLDHLPEPRIAAVLDSGAHMTPSLANESARRLALMVQDHYGSVLLSVADGVSREVADSFVAGLGSCFNLVWRHGEPDDDPTLGFMACADAVVVFCGRPATLVDAAASDLPVFVGEAPGLFGARNAIVKNLIAADYVRVLDEGFSPWPRQPLDEAGRVAAFLRQRFGL